MARFWILLLLTMLFSGFARAELEVKILADGLHSPWALTELPDNSWLITQRSGQLIHFNKGSKTIITGTPEVFFAGQGGLLDVALHPDFNNNRMVYLSFAQGTSANNHLALFKARLNSDSTALEQGKVIFTVQPGKDTPVHYGGRIAFLSDGSLLLSSGDGFDYRESAQLQGSQLGKILRMDDNGKPLPDNPYFAEQNAQFVWSLGHRNPQALFYEPVSDLVFAHEHGPAGGDEINIITKGNNYGWPVITNGKDYSGANISPFTEYPGMQQPFLDWTPSIAPSDMIRYQGDEFPQFNGHLLVTTLKTQELRLVKIQEQNVSEQQSYLTHLKERFRGIEQSREGEVLLLTDSGKLLQLTQN